jgi:hypothetical protein
MSSDLCELCYNKLTSKCAECVHCDSIGINKEEDKWPCKTLEGLCGHSYHNHCLPKEQNFCAICKHMWEPKDCICFRCTKDIYEGARDCDALPLGPNESRNIKIRMCDNFHTFHIQCSDEEPKVCIQCNLNLYDNNVFSMKWQTS